MILLSKLRRARLWKKEKNSQDGTLIWKASQEPLTNMENISMVTTEKFLRDSKEMPLKKTIIQLINSPKTWLPTTPRRELPEEKTQSQMVTSISLKLNPTRLPKKSFAPISRCAELMPPPGWMMLPSTDLSTLGSTSMSWRLVRLTPSVHPLSSDTWLPHSDG